MNLDYTVFEKINHLAASVPMFNPIMKFLAEDAQYILILGVIVYWFIRMESNRRMITEALLAACMGVGISAALGHFLYRDRPFAGHHVIQLIAHPANASFPSDHATLAFAVSTAIWGYRKKEGVIWLVLSALIAVSRVWTGVHYPTDVIAGAALGIILAAFVHSIFRKFKLMQALQTLAIQVYERFEIKVWPKPASDKPSSRAQITR
ncbi:undecaprenyl-diphosphatase [Paenibacillus tuaregi]|uniref:undecaprenyl-diphosphatase n=1 Tax=Paenibacillus tuaregi TaxID=1816681 RepID=UPI000AC85464|nr:undecaprenyl-diphosphatase [Paenibacillus tuaregi]